MSIKTIPLSPVTKIEKEIAKLSREDLVNLCLEANRYIAQLENKVQNACEETTQLHDKVTWYMIALRESKARAKRFYQRSLKFEGQAEFFKIQAGY